MKKIDSPYKIKPVIKVNRNGFLQLSILSLVLLYMILCGAFYNGKFNIDMFLFNFTLITITFYIAFRISYRTIEVKEDGYIYIGLLRKIKVDYLSISKIIILEKKKKKNSTYSMIIIGHENWQISDIQKYKRKDIGFFINKICEKNRQIALVSDEINENLSKVRWLHDDI